MTPEKAAMILNGVVGSLALWIAELEELERGCPGKVAHLLASMKQGHRSLQQMIKRDASE